MTGRLTLQHTLPIVASLVLASKLCIGQANYQIERVCISDDNDNYMHDISLVPESFHRDGQEWEE